MNTREQVVNYVLHLLDLTFTSDTARAAPTKVQTAMSTTCNLACPYCMREAMGIRENKFMELEAFARHVGELKAATCVSLFGLGEPFLHPQFFEFVALCKQHQLMVMTSTHGMSLTPEVNERIIESGLDDLHISMDGATKEIFEWLRKNAIFETVIERVSDLAERKRRQGSELPRMNVNMTVSIHNIRQVPDMVELAHRMGCQSVSYSSAVAYKPEDEHIGVLDTPIFERQLERAKRRADRLGLGFSFWRQKAIGYRDDLYQAGAAYGCGQLNGDQIIERDGRMKLCCYIEEDIENVFEHGPLAAFNGEGVRRARLDLMEGRVRTECQGCLYLRERTPFWIQTQLNEATRIVEGSELLTGEDRERLMGLIEEVRAEKDRLHPEHAGARRIGGKGRANGDGDGGGKRIAQRDPSEMPVY